jgi:hypothetical protein
MTMNHERGDAPLFRASILSAAGILLSGPLGLLVVMLVHDQPAWHDAGTFIRNYHPVQTVPYVFGFMLIFGIVLFLSRCAALFPQEERHRTYTVLVLTAAFASMIVINYSLQIAGVPWLVRQHDEMLAYFTMTNPGALSWGLEMFGYGVAGVGTWLVVPVFSGGSRGGRRQWIRLLLVGNGIVSVAGAAITSLDLSWVQSPAGLASFIGWNLLLLAAMILVAIETRGVRR